MPWPSTPCRSAQPIVGPRVCGASLQRVVIAAASERVTAAGDLAAPSWPGALRRTDGSRPGQFAHAASRFPRLYTAQSPGIRALLSDPAEVTRPSSRLSVFAEPGNDVHRVPEILCPRNPPARWRMTFAQLRQLAAPHEWPRTPDRAEHTSREDEPCPMTWSEMPEAPVGRARIGFGLRLYLVPARGKQRPDV